MSWDYVEEKVKEAARIGGGNATRTKNALMDLALDDPKLLRALTKPHLNGIAAHAIRRIAEDIKIPKKTAQDNGKAAATLEAEKPKKKNSFGMDILKAVAGDRATLFGQEAYAAPLGKSKVSQRHIDAIYAIAKKSGKE